MNWNPIAKEITINIEHLYNITNYIGSSYYDIALLHVINRVAPVLETTGYLCCPNSPPVIAGWTGYRADINSRVENYVTNQYQYDPILSEFPQAKELNSAFYTVLKKSEVKHDKYRSIFFDQPKFASEVVFAIKEKTGWNILKFYLEESKLSKKALNKIGELAYVIYPACKRHALNTDFSTTMVSRPKTLDRLLLLLNDRFPQLTGRERQVCALTILGKRTQDISQALELSLNTVMTYRRRAYEKLAVNNAFALVSELI